MLPNSLTKVLSFALGYSPRLPVSVCGTGDTGLCLEGFLGSLAQRLRLGDPLRFRNLRPDLPGHFISLRRSHRNYQRSGSSTILRHSIAPYTGIGMLTDCPSPTLFSLGLGPTNPMWTDLASETLGIRRSRFSRDLRYSYRHSHFCSLHRSLQYGFDACRTLPYCSFEPVSSVVCLAPLNFPRRTV